MKLAVLTWLKKIVDSACFPTDGIIQFSVVDQLSIVTYNRSGPLPCLIFARYKHSQQSIYFFQNNYFFFFLLLKLILWTKLSQMTQSLLCVFLPRLKLSVWSRVLLFPRSKIRYRKMMKIPITLGRKARWDTWKLLMLLEGSFVFVSL